MSISIIIPIFNESENLKILIERLLKTIKKVKIKKYEIIFVNDGSTDNSLEILKIISSKNSKIKILSLSRNFGHQNALSAGIDYASNDLTIIMDGDLQDPPEIIPKLIDRINKGYNVVFAIRKKRKENIFKKVMYYIFYRFLYLVSDIKIPLDSGDFSALDKKALTHLKNFKEKNKFIRGLRSWIGFKQISLSYDREKRYKGKAKYSFLSLLKLAINGIISFSSFPLKLASLTGFIITIFSFMYIIYLFYTKIFIGINPSGWTSLMVIILFLGGFNLLILGIIGEYISRIYDDVRNRPTYIIEDKINF